MTPPLDENKAAALVQESAPGQEQVVPVSLSMADRLYAVFEILACAGIITTLVCQMFFLLLGVPSDSILRHPKLTATFILLEALLLLGVIFLLQKLRGLPIWELGFLAESYGREFRVGLVVVPLLFAVSVVVSQFFRHLLPQWSSESNPLLELIQTPTDLAYFMVVSLVAGGIKEEVQRAFILDRFRRYLSAAMLGVVLWSAAFGVGHAVQGFDSAMGAGLFGMIFGLLYLRRKNVIAAMTAHALYDILVLSGYWFWDSAR